MPVLPLSLHGRYGRKDAFATVGIDYSSRKQNLNSGLLLRQSKTDHQIAETLNDRWLRTGTGQRFTRLRVRRIRRAYGIRGLAQHKREAGWFTTAEISAQLHI